MDSVGPRTIKFSIFQPQEFKNKHDNYFQSQQSPMPNSCIAENPNYKNVASPQKLTFINSTQKTSEKSSSIAEDNIELKKDPLKDDEPQVINEEEIVEERKFMKESLLNVDEVIDVPSPVEFPVAEIIPQIEQSEEKVSVAPSKE